MNIKNYNTWLFIIYVLTVMYLSFNSFVIFNNQWKYDIYIHFIEYFILGFLFVNAIMDGDCEVNIKWIFLFILSFASIDEAIQYFTPNRISSLKDISIDVVGGMSGSLLLNYFKNSRNNDK